MEAEDVSSVFFCFIFFPHSTLNRSLKGFFFKKKKRKKEKKQTQNTYDYTGNK